MKFAQQVGEEEDIGDVNFSRKTCNLLCEEKDSSSEC